jgi:beta-N-acetylhexosaminidase
VLGSLVVASLSIMLAASPTTVMDDGQLAGARVITGFSGHHPPKALRRMIRTGEVSGVILFDGNVGGVRSVRRLTTELQSIPRPAGSPPLLVTVDQEGGLVRRLPGPPKPSARAIGARGPLFAERLGHATGKSLRSMGVNVDLAPVLDLGRPGRAIFDEGRTFARKPRAVGQIGAEFALGLAAGGVAATAKHFPGLGAARLNTDNAVQKIRLPADKLRRDLSGAVRQAGRPLAGHRDRRAPRPARLPGRLDHGRAGHGLRPGGRSARPDGTRRRRGGHRSRPLHEPG